LSDTALQIQNFPSGSDSEFSVVRFTPDIVNGKGIF